MKIERMNKGEWGKLRAFFDIKTSEGFVIKGFKLVDGINGMFVGMPSQKGKEDEFFDTVFVDKELRDELSQLAIEEYKNPSEANTTPADTANDVSMDESKPESVSEDLNITENNEKVQPFDDNDIPF